MAAVPVCSLLRRLELRVYTAPYTEGVSGLLAAAAAGAARLHRASHTEGVS
jgi:hypothetical protein